MLPSRIYYKYQFLLILITNLIVNTIGSPVQQQTSFEIPSSNPRVKSIPSSYITSYKNINQLDEFYSAIVNDVVNTTIYEIMDAAPETFLTIHELQYSGKEYCRTSLYSFMSILRHHLDQYIRDSLPVSIKPLLENDQRHEDILELNQYISQQLGAIINPSYRSHQIILEVYAQNEQEHSSPLARIWKIISNRQWYLTLRHESNESKALESWLHSWLMDIELTLKDEFDSKISNLLI